jgi:hypothetical protein
VTDEIRQAIVETAMEWTRLYDRAQKSNYVTDAESADRCAIRIRGLCRKLRKAEKQTEEPTIEIPGIDIAQGS